MSGFMRKTALVVGAVALIAATAGAAAVALAPAMAGTAGVAGVSAATLTAIGTYGGLASGVLSAISVATAPKASNQGSATTFQTNPQSGLPYAIGRTRMSGLRMFAATNTRPGYTKFNDLLWFGALLSIGGQIGGIEKFTIDNEIVTFDASGNAVGAYHDYQGQKIHLGGAPMASGLALSLGGGAAPGWTSQHKLSGITHAMWCLRYNKQGEMYGAGAPEPAWIGKWVRVYDPRLDSTYPGGSGPCRALDESTYVWSDNPALHALTWALGRVQNGKRTCGIGAPIANIRVAEFVECANVCEANSWTAGGVEWTTDSKWDTLKRMLQAGGARPTQTGAMIGCLVSMPRTAIATIESWHLLDSLSIAATKSRRDRFNSVIPRYVDEDSDWSMISGTVVSVPEYVAADGGARTKEIDYPLVQVFSGQVAMQPGQLAAYDIVNSREAGPINFTTGPEWIGLKTGDVVLLNVPEEGLVNQPVLITRRAPDPSTGKVSFSAETETYSKHAYALGQSTTPPAPFSLTAPDLKPPAPVAASWAAVGSITGEGLPAIVVTGNADMPSADAVVIDYRRSGVDEWTRAVIVSANDPVRHVISPLESAAAYDVRVGYRVGEIDGDFVILYAITGEGKLSGIEDGATNGASQAEKDKLAQLEQDAATAATNIAAAQAQIAAIEGSVSADFAALNASVSTLNSEVDVVQGNIASLQSATSAVQQSVSTLQGDVVAAQTAISTISIDLTELTQSTAQDIANVNATVALVQQDAAAIRGDVGALQTQAAGIIGNISSLDGEVTSLQTQAAGIIASVGQLGTEVDQVQTTVSTQGGYITTLQQSVSNINGTVATLSSTVSTQGGYISTLQQSVSTAQGDLVTLTTRVNAGGGYNLLPNAGFEDGLQGWAGSGPSWGWANSDNWGTRAYAAIDPAQPYNGYAFIDATRVLADATGNFTASFDWDVWALNNSAFDIWAEILWLDGNINEISRSGGNHCYGTGARGFWYGNGDGSNRAATIARGTAPAGTIWAMVRLIAHGPQLAGFAVRQVKLERGSVATPYTMDTSIAQTFTALSTLEGQYVSLSTTLSTQGGQISTLQTVQTTQAGTIAQHTTDISTANANIGQNATAISTLNGNVASLSSTVSTQGGSISTLQQTVSTLQGDLAQLTLDVNAGGGNLLQNTDLGLDTSAWIFGNNGVVAVGERLLAGDAWAPRDENGLRIVQSNGSTAGYSDWAQYVAAEAGKWYDVSVRAASHRCNIELIIQWLNSSNQAITADSTGVIPPNNGAGEALSSWLHLGFKRQAPAGTSRALFYLRKYATNGGVSDPSSYAWFIRPQFADTLASSRSPLAYSPGSSRSSISIQATALSTTNGNLASLSTTVSTQGGSISTLQSSVSTLSGTVSTLSSTVSTQGGQISNLQSVTTSHSGSISTLQTQVNAGGGNILQNTDLAVDTSSWGFFYSGEFAEPLRNQPTEEYRPIGENALAIHQTGAGDSYANFLQNVAVQAGKIYEFSVMASAHRCRVQLILQFIDGSNNELAVGYTAETIPGTSGQALANWLHMSRKLEAPAGTVSANVYLRKLRTIQGFGYTDSWAWFCRPQLAETLAGTVSPLAYSPGGQRSVISVNATAISGLNSRTASLETTVSTQGGYIATLQSVQSSQGGTIASHTQTINAHSADIQTNAQAISTTNGNLASLSSTVSTQGSSISTLQSAMSTAQGDVATLKTQVSAGGGNLLQNTDLAIDTSAWGFGATGQVAAGARLAAGQEWALSDENALRISQDNNDTNGYADWTQGLTVQADVWYDVSVRVGAHRCQVEVIIQWLAENNAAIGSDSAGAMNEPGSAGYWLAGWYHYGFKRKAPAGTRRAIIYLRKYATNAGQANSYAWFCRPQVAQTLPTSASPLAYSPGSARSAISVQATALSNLNVTFASLETRVSSAEGSVSTLQSSMSSANGSISSLQQSVSSLNGSVSTLQQSSSTQAGQISTLQSTVSTQGATISSNSSAISTVTGSLATINTIITASSNPNLVPNGGFENGLRGWTPGGASPQGWGSQIWSWGYFASNGTGFTGGNNSNNYAYIDSAQFNVAGDGNVMTQSFDLDWQGSAGCVAYGEIVWLRDDGSFVNQTGTTQVGPRVFDVTGNGRVKYTHVSPAGARRAYARVVFHAPNGATITGMNVRQMKCEFGNVATPYSGEATAGQMYQAYSDLNSSHASLSTTVSAQGGYISTLQSTTTSLSGTVSSLSSTVSGQGVTIQSLQQVQSTHAGTIATLQQRMTVGGNLLQNTEYGIGTEAWDFYAFNQNPSIFDWSRNLAGDGWRPTNEHNVGIRQLNNDGSSASQWYSNRVPVTGGNWYEGSLNSASHRCYTYVRIDWYDGNGQGIASSGSGRSDSFPGFYPGNGGANIGAWQRLFVKAQAPGNATTALLTMVKEGTSEAGATDSYAWFCRPQIAAVFAETQGPTAYFPGRTTATVAVNAQAISTLNGQFSSLSSTVSTQGSSISQNATAISNLSGTVATLSSTVSSQGASISNLQSTTSTLTGNVATLTTKVQAGGGYNLIINGGFENGLTGWSPMAGSWGWAQGDNWGSRAYLAVSGTVNGYYFIDSPRFNVDATGLFSASFDWDVWAADNYPFDVWSEILWFNGSGIEISRSGGLHATGNGSRGFWYSNTDGSNRRDTTNTGYAPAGTVQALVRLIAHSERLGGFAVRQVKMERGGLATPYTNDATVVQQFQALSTLNTQYASLSSTIATQGVTISTNSTAITTLNNNVATLFGSWGVEVQVGGVISGIKLNNNGSRSDLTFQSDKVSFVDTTGSSTRTEYIGGTWRIYAGATMLIWGAAFGSANQFVRWFGPALSNISQCTEGNGIEYLKTNGDAYFGGSLSAGTLRNSVTGTSPAANANALLENIGSNGHTRSVVLSYTWMYNQVVTSPPAAVSPSATLRLYRVTSGGNVLIATLNVGPGEFNAEPAPGGGTLVFTSMSGSVTVNDTSGGTAVSYFADIATRNVAAVNGQQRITIVSTET